MATFAFSSKNINWCMLSNIFKCCQSCVRELNIYFQGTILTKLVNGDSSVSEIYIEPVCCCCWPLYCWSASACQKRFLASSSEHRCSEIQDERTFCYLKERHNKVSHMIKQKNKNKKSFPANCCANMHIIKSYSYQCLIIHLSFLFK